MPTQPKKYDFDDPDKEHYLDLPPKPRFGKNAQGTAEKNLWNIINQNNITYIHVVTIFLTIQDVILFWLFMYIVCK